MIGPLQFERTSKENVKDLALSKIPAETELCCMLSLGSHHELQVVLQSGTVRQRQKVFGVWAEGCFKAGQKNLKTGWAGAQDLPQEISAAQNCRRFS